MNLRPLYDFVFIEKDPVEDKIGSIYIPEKAKQKSTRGKVVAVGPGLNVKGRRIPPLCKVGDIVHWNEYRGMDFEVDGQKLMVLHDDEIEAVEEAA